MIPISVLYPVKVNSFYCLVEKLCLVCKIPYVKSNFSKKMYSNVRLAFLVCYKEKLNVSYRRFVEICDENDLQRMLCVKRIPHFSTLQKFVKRTPKKVFEKMVRACGKTLGLSGVETSIDGTGFSNTNPSHFYIKRIAEQGNKVSVKNFTKTLFLIDNETKLILNVKTFSRNVNESIHFKQMVSELENSLKSVLADKGYDSMSNREYCWNKGIKVHIPLRKYKSQQTRMGEQNYTAKRRRSLQKFDEVKYKRRSLIESVNSAIKRTLGNYTNNNNKHNKTNNQPNNLIGFLQSF